MGSQTWQAPLCTGAALPRPSPPCLRACHLAQMAACHLGAPADLADEGAAKHPLLPFVLIQGPPGTGKTHTVKASWKAAGALLCCPDPAGTAVLVGWPSSQIAHVHGSSRLPCACIAHFGEHARWLTPVWPAALPGRACLTSGTWWHTSGTTTASWQPLRRLRRRRRGSMPRRPPRSTPAAATS